MRSLRKLPLWLGRAGALLAVASVVLPQVRVDGAPWISPLGWGYFSRGLEGAWLAAPAVLGLGVLAGPARGALLAAQTTLLFASAFGLAVLGSILQSDPIFEAAPSPAPGTLSLALFAVPLAASAWLLARLMSGAPSEGTAALVRGSLGLFLILEGAFRAVSGWRFLLAWPDGPGPVPVLVSSLAVWASSGAGALVLAAVLLRVRMPRSEIVHPPSIPPVDLTPAAR